MGNNETFTIQLQPIAEGFRVTIKELERVFDVTCSQEDALDAAKNAIIDALDAREEQEAAAQAS